MLETFRRYIPKAELEAFIAEMTERRADGEGRAQESGGAQNQEPEGVKDGQRA
jgi:hypothetical protein